MTPHKADSMKKTVSTHPATRLATHPAPFAATLPTPFAAIPRATAFTPFAALFAALLLLSSCASRTSGPTARKPVNVRVETVTAEGTAPARTYVGTVRPSKSTTLSARCPGTLASLRITEGQSVSKGDTLAVIESRSVTSALEMAEAKLDQARDGYERLSQVYESGSVPEVKMIEIKTDLAQAEAAVSIARQACDDLTILAPYDGVISDIFTDEGVSLIIEAPIARLVDIGSIEITIPVPENEIWTITVGAPATLSVPALGEGTIDCRVTKKGISASPLSHSYECTLEPVSSSPGLMPGMVSKVSLPAMGPDGTSGTIVIPASAIKTGTSGRYVWTVEDGLARRADITTGGFSSAGIIVTSGLVPGDRIIVSGAQKVSGGMKVNEIE